MADGVEDFTYELLGGQTPAGLDRYSQEAMPRMVVHNTHLYVQCAEEINQLVDSHVELLETVVPRDLYDVTGRKIKDIGKIVSNEYITTVVKHYVELLKTNMDDIYDLYNLMKALEIVKKDFGVKQ